MSSLSLAGEKARSVAGALCDLENWCTERLALVSHNTSDASSETEANID